MIVDVLLEIALFASLTRQLCVKCQLLLKSQPIQCFKYWSQRTFQLHPQFRYRHRNSRSDSKLLTSGMDVLQNTLQHLGHLKLESYSTRPGSCGTLLTQYSQKLAKQFVWLHVTAFQIMLLQIWQDRWLSSTLGLIMRCFGSPRRNIPFSEHRNSFSAQSSPYFLQFSSYRSITILIQ